MEKWKQSGLSEWLEVSNTGQVRLSKSRDNGRYKYAEGKHKKGFILTQKLKHGYQTVRVSENGKRKQYTVGRLVCEAFKGPPKSKGLHAAHRDGNPLNNTPKNLYWATVQQNINDREKHGKTMRGDTHYCAKLKSKDIPKIRKLIEKGFSNLSISKKFNVSHYTISDIKRGKSWKTV